MFLDVGGHLFRQLARDGRRTLSGLGGLSGSLSRLLCVLALDLLLLQIPGHRAALLHFRVFLHGLAVVIVRRGLDMLAFGTLHRLCGVFPDGLAELAPAEAVHGLRRQLGTVCALRADIFMLDLIELAMHKAVNAVSGSMGKALDRTGLFRRLLLCQLLPGGVQLLAPALHPQLGCRRLLLPAFPPKLGLRDILSRSGSLRCFPCRGIPFRTVIHFSRCSSSMNYPKSTPKRPPAPYIHKVGNQPGKLSISTLLELW